MRVAKSKIIANFATSEGWKLNEPITNHLFTSIPEIIGGNINTVDNVFTVNYLGKNLRTRCFTRSARTAKRYA